MTIWISQELPLFNFERFNILCGWIRHPCEMLWIVEFFESFRCSILRALINYGPESDISVKSYYHLDFPRASFVQFRASRYIMRLNRKSGWKVITIWICQKLLLLNFERLVILCAWIGHACEMLWSFEFLEGFYCSISRVSIYYTPESHIRVKSYDLFDFSRASVVQFRASRYIMRQNRTSVWKVMTMWIYQELLLLNFERVDILCAWIGHPSEKLWPFGFLKSFRCSISSVSIYYAPESDIRVKWYDQVNFSRASVV